MASAGRILIMPKGNYDANTEYEMLDLVFNGGASWVAKKNVKGIEPTDDTSEHWMKMCESVDLTEIIMRIAALESQMLGTISLDDIDLTPYATKSELTNYATKTDIFALDEKADWIQNRTVALENAVSTLNGAISGNSTKMKIMSYKGNGTWGYYNPCSLYCEDFAPRVIIYLGYQTYYVNGGSISNVQHSPTASGKIWTESAMFCDHLTTEYQYHFGFKEASNNDNNLNYAKKSADGKTVYWYINGDAATSFSQLNHEYNTYYFLAIG